MAQSDRHEEVSKLFLAACDLEAGARAAFLDEACAHDPSLRAEVEALLAKDTADSGFLKHRTSARLICIGEPKRRRNESAPTRSSAASARGAWAWSSLANYGRSLMGLERYGEAESALLESHGILEAALGAENRRTISTIKELVELYTTWHAAEPSEGHDATAAEWRAKMPEVED